MKNVKEITTTVKGKEWTNAIDKAFNNKKKDIKIDGFRKGAVTKEIFIKKVGIESLFMDACDIAIEDAYKNAMKDIDFEIVCEPSVSIEAVNKDEATFKFTFVGKPEVKLGDYKKLGVKKETVKVTKEEIEHEIEHIMEHMSEVVIKENGTVEKGNTAVIDFEGFINGEKFEGGSGANYPLEIGSNSFIPGFEDGLVGMTTGETKDLNLKFPENYVAELKGKDVTFKVTIREIKERVKPEMDADFFEDLGIEGVNSKETLEAHVKEDIKHNKEHQAEDKYIDELLRKATDNMKVELNDEIVASEVKRMINQYNQELTMQGLSLDQYLRMTGSKIEDLENMMKPQAEIRIKTRYLLEEIVKVEKITVTDKEVKAEIKEAASKYQMKEDEFLKAIGGEEMIKYDCEMKKAIEIIKEG